MYIGLRDFWVEGIRTAMQMSVQHAKASPVYTQGRMSMRYEDPKIVLTLSDTSLTIKADGIALKGEKGTSVPNLNVKCPGTTGHSPLTTHH